MIDTRTNALSDRVQPALGKCTELIERRGPGQWNLPLRNGGVLPCRATLKDEWLHLDVDAGKECRAAQPERYGAWVWLVRNGTLPGGVKYALDARARVRIRAELPLLDDQDEFDVCARITTVWDGLRAASAGLHGPLDGTGGQWPGTEGKRDEHQAA